MAPMKPRRRNGCGGKRKPRILSFQWLEAIPSTKPSNHSCSRGNVLTQRRPSSLEGLLAPLCSHHFSDTAYQD
jgi:hypothetical protein